MPKRRNQQRKFIAEGPMRPGQALVLATPMPRRKARKARASAPPPMRMPALPRTGPSIKPMIPHSLREEVCSVTDPFCPAAIGAKWLDEFPIATHTYCMKKIFSITTSAAGSSNFVFQPGVNAYNFDFVDAGVAFGNGCTQTASGTWATIQGQSRGCRVVSAGCRFWNALAMSAAGGYCHVGTCGAGEFSGVTITQGTLPNAIGDVQAVDIRSEWAWVAKPQSADARSLLSGTTNTISPSVVKGNVEWDALLVQFNGPVSTLVGYVEMVIHYEYTTIVNSTVTVVDGRVDAVRPKPSPKQDILKSAADNVLRALPAVTTAATNVVDKIGGMAMSAAGTALANYLFPGSGALVSGAGMLAGRPKTFSMKMLE